MHSTIDSNTDLNMKSKMAADKPEGLTSLRCRINCLFLVPLTLVLSLHPGDVIHEVNLSLRVNRIEIMIV